MDGAGGAARPAAAGGETGACSTRGAGGVADPLFNAGAFFGQTTLGATGAPARARAHGLRTRHLRKPTPTHTPPTLLPARARYPDPFFDAATTTVAYPFHEIDPDAYAAVFDAHILGAGSRVAAALGADGGATVLRADLGAMLNELLGRQARKAELQLFFT